MNTNNLHPSVREFQSFVSRHPKLAVSVRKSGRPWQEYYEKWALLGEDDPFWDDYKSNDKQTDDKRETSKSGKQTEIFEQLKKLSENVDLDKVQSSTQQLSGTISTIQELIGQFQNTKKSSEFSESNSIKHPGWFKD